jgi:D-arabinose 1-dehydrogenase-like Zn-dependent alcohol dehydrogenase
MQQTYRAVQVTKPGHMEVVERALIEPTANQVRIRVEAAGICHSDRAVVDGVWPNIAYPRVPGHEVVGRIEAVGSHVRNWKLNQRVGVGWFGGNCGLCEECRRGDLIYCRNLLIPGINMDGGYAEAMIAEATSLAAVPEDLEAVDAAPLLCAGLTTFNALRHSHIRAGGTVAIHGVGGLGHLAVQFSRRLGFRTIAIARGKDKDHRVADLGAHQYIDSDSVDAAQALRDLGGADAILSTVADAASMSALMPALTIRGKFILVGIPSQAISFAARTLIDGGRSIVGEMTGTAIEGEDTLRFSALQNVKPVIEIVPLEGAAEAYAKMMRGEARFRMVIQMVAKPAHA